MSLALKRAYFFQLLVLFSFLWAPSGLAAAQGEGLDFLILPTENQASTYRRFLPVKRYLEKKITQEVRLVLGQSFEMVEKEMAEARGDLIFLDPSAYCKMKHKLDLKPLVKMVWEGEKSFRSALVVRKGAKYSKIAGIRGARLALGRPGSSSSYLIPRAMLREVGLGLESFSRVGSLQNEDQIALSVLVGDYDIGAMSEEVARKYKEYGLRILKLSESIPQFLLSASPKMEPDFAKRVQKLLLNYIPDEYESIAFSSVEDREYNIVRIMLKNITGQDFLSYPEDALKIGLLPLYSSITLYKRFSPLAELLSRSVGRQFRLVIPKDFEEFVQLVRSQAVDFSYQNPYVYLLLAREGQIRSLALTVSREPLGAMDRFRGVIITRKKSRIDRLSELKGKKVMIVSKKSAGGYWFQKLLLQSKGLDIDQQARLLEGKRHEDVVLAVYREEAEAGFVREAALQVVRDLVDMEKIQVIARTPYYPNWPFAVQNKTPAELASKVKDVLINLPQGDEILVQAKIHGFTKSSAENFRNLERKVEFE